MKRPVILQILPALEMGGVERGTVEIAEAVARAGWTSLVASAGGRMVEEVERAGGRYITLPLRAKSPAGILANAARLSRLIRAEGVDIVHARSRAPAWSAWLAARRTGVRFVTTYHGAYGEELPFKRAYNSVMAKGERVIVASRFMADLVINRHRIDPERIRIIPRGVDPAVFDPAAVAPARVARLRAAWNVPEAASVCLLPGRLTAWKGQRILLEAAAQLPSELHVVLLGADQGRRRYTEELRALADRMGLGARVHLPGDCADMPAALLAADIVVHASIEAEAFGRVVIEAQAMCRPVIASDLGGPAETVSDGETGWLVRPRDPAALAARIAAVLAMPEVVRRSVGAAARDDVLARYTTAAMQAATMGEYRTILGARGG